MPSRFYFEVTVKKTDPMYRDLLVAQFIYSNLNSTDELINDSEISFRIGLTSTLFDLLHVQRSENDVMTVYWASQDGIFHNNSINPPDQVYIGLWCEERSDSVGPIGLGFDYPTGKIYFTKDGQLIGDIYQVTKRDRWKAGIDITVGPKINLTVNFGSTAFAFQDWETPIEEIEAIYKEQWKGSRVVYGAYFYGKEQ